VESWQYFISLSLAQALAATLLAWVFHRYWRVYARPYLGVWSLGFLALSFHLLGSTAAHFMAISGLGAHPIRTPLSLLSLTLAYAHVALILIGVRALELGQPPRRRLLLAAVAVAAVVGTVSVLAFTRDPAAFGARVLMRVGLRDGITGLAYVITALLLLRTAQARQSYGRWLAAMAFAVYGGALTLGAGLMLAETVAGPLLPLIAYQAAFHPVAMLMLGLGLVIWLLEDERARALAARQEAARMSLHDPLTGLANRRHFCATLDRSLERPAQAEARHAVLAIGLDRFQAINNAYGSEVGDRVLVACAARLATSDPHWQLGRLEGDQFALASAAAEGEAPLRLAQRLQSLLDQPYRIGTQDLHVPASIGLALSPEDGQDAERLLNNAQLALRQAKRLGGHGLQFYAPSLNDQARRRLSLQIELRRALAENEFEAMFQPVFRARDGRLAGFEALARWRHPRHGMLAPDRFVQALEEIGLLVELDLLIVERALVQLARWRQDSGEDISVSVNLCARSFQRHDLPERMEAMLRAHGLPPACLAVEITESSALDDPAASRRTLDRLSRHGIRVWLDDFGTGHSSLAQLLRLPVHGLKLDRSFLDPDGDQPRQGALVAATVQLATDLGMQVVAEGVESERQAEFARGRGVALLQGYLFGGALAASEAGLLVSRARQASGRVA
jgi:diguanylate cyclase (GGDEF)-like protein